jgi:hypothetical protein
MNKNLKTGRHSVKEATMHIGNQTSMENICFVYYIITDCLTVNSVKQHSENIAASFFIFLRRFRFYLKHFVVHHHYYRQFEIYSQFSST